MALKFNKKFRKKEAGCATLKRKLDEVFSRFIRLRDQVAPGVCKCITCGNPHPIKEIHCGHFVSRSRLATRYNEKNCNAQCVKCNTFLEGNHYLYGLNLNRKHGEGTAELLILASKQNAKFTRMEYEVMIQHYAQKVAEMGGKEFW